jgi:ABC-2 type transport system ATP-binding protein
MRELAGAGVHLETITLQRPTLDDVFLAKTGRTLQES